MAANLSRPEQNGRYVADICIFLNDIVIIILFNLYLFILIIR